MKQKIFIAGVWGIGNISIMEEFDEDTEVEFLKDDFFLAGKMRKVWRFVNQKLGGHGSGIVRWFLRTKLLDSQYALSHCEFDSNEENNIVIFNSALLHYYSKEYFERLRKKHQNIRYILYIIDPMPNGLWKEIQYVKDVFDKVMTMHPYNCQKYGFQYLPYAYAKPKMEKPVENLEKINLFYCGVVDDYRQELLKEMIRQCEHNGIRFDFWLKPYQNNDMKHAHVHYVQIPYAENVQRLKNAECILEIMHKGYVGITQRYLEAVIYNKRLITNNVEIRELPYYNPCYMQYFEKVEDIDWEWMRSDKKVDYHYKGDFSVQAWKRNLTNLLKDVEQNRV